jgi:hypothetical protein
VKERIKARKIIDPGFWSLEKRRARKVNQMTDVRGQQQQEQQNQREQQGKNKVSRAVISRRGAERWDVGPLDLGLKPDCLTDEVLMEMLGIALRCRGNIKEHAIFRGVK